MTKKGGRVWKCHIPNLSYRLLCLSPISKKCIVVLETCKQFTKQSKNSLTTGTMKALKGFILRTWFSRFALFMHVYNLVTLATITISTCEWMVLGVKLPPYSFIALEAVHFNVVCLLEMKTVKIKWCKNQMLCKSRMLSWDWFGDNRECSSAPIWYFNMNNFLNGGSLLVQCENKVTLHLFLVTFSICDDYLTFTVIPKIFCSTINAIQFV